MADRIAGGDLQTRMPETGVGEIGALEHSFNAMAGSLQATQAELAASRARIVAAADERLRHMSATSMTGRSSDSCRWGSSCAWPSRTCRLTSPTWTPSSVESRTSSTARSTIYARSHVASIRRSSPREASCRR